MSRYQHQLRPTPKGAASALELTAMSEAHARHIKGFLPARYGQLYLSHVWTDLTTTFEPVLGLAWYGDDDGTAPQFAQHRLFVWRGYTRVDVFRLQIGMDYPNYRMPIKLLRQTTLTDPLPLPYNEHRLAPLTPTQDGDLNAIRQANQARVVSVQIGNELFFVHAPASSIRRIKRHTDGTFGIYRCGIDPATGFIYMAVASSLQGRMPTAQTTYRYRLCFEDESGRLSSPIGRALAEKTYTCIKTQGATSVRIDFVHPRPPGIDGVRNAVLFRAAQGTEDFYSVVCHQYASDRIGLANASSTSVVDVSSEDDLVTGQLCPAIGENDPPPKASVLAAHGARMWCNDMTFGEWKVPPGGGPPVANIEDHESRRRIWASHISGPTQFATIPVSDDTSLGGALVIGQDASDPITALGSLGQMLGVWTRNAFYYVHGGSPADWYVLKQANIGCVQGPTLQIVDGKPYWLGPDGVYVLSDAVTPQIISLPVNDLFNGPIAGEAGSIEVGHA